MQEKHLYEYAVIRVLPKVEREEFMNVGIIMFSKKAKYIQLQYHIDEEKLRCFSNELDLQLIYDTLQSFQKIALGTKDSGKIGAMEIPERFRWITAERSSCIQTSRPHSGFSNDLDKTIKELFRELVL